MSTARLAKPLLRGALIKSIKIHLSIAVGLSFTGAMLYKTFVRDARREKTLEFFRNYDVDAEAERLRKMGFFIPKDVDPEIIAIADRSFTDVDFDS